MFTVLSVWVSCLQAPGLGISRICTGCNSDRSLSTVISSVKRVVNRYLYSTITLFKSNPCVA
jgi:hypothetical protein